MSASRLLCPQLQTSAHLADIDASGHNPTHATQQFAPHSISSSAGQTQAAAKWAKQIDRADPSQSARVEQSSKWVAIPAGTISVYESAAYPTSLARRRPYSRSVIDPDFFS